MSKMFSNYTNEELAEIKERLERLAKPSEVYSVYTDTGEYIVIESKEHNIQKRHFDSVNDAHEFIDGMELGRQLRLQEER